MLGETKAVTAAGGNFVMFGAIGFLSLVTRPRTFAGTTGDLVTNGVALAIALAIGLTGFAMYCRWRGWRIYAGILAWLFIALGIIAVVADLAGKRTDSMAALIPLGIGAYTLWAKRQEKKAPAPLPVEPTKPELPPSHTAADPT